MTHKTCKLSAYHGYALHALIRVPDVVKVRGKSTTDNFQEPLLIEAFELTSASTDIIDVTLGMIKKTLALRPPGQGPAQRPALQRQGQ